MTDTDDFLRYFKVGLVPVKIEFNEYGARAAYAWENGTFKIDNRYIADVMDGEDVVELNEKEFVQLISESH